MYPALYATDETQLPANGVESDVEVTDDDVDDEEDEDELDDEEKDDSAESK